MATKTIPGNGQDTSALTTVATSNGPTRLDLRIAWARETLGVAPDATQADVRRAFLAGMPNRNYLPTEAWQQAYFTLTSETGNSSEAPDPSCFLREEAEQLREEVDEFARRYFSLPVDIRHRMFDELLCRCPRDCQATARLESLSAGISIDPSIKLTKESGTLVGFLVELYTLPLIERATRRTAIFETLKPELEAWEAVAHKLRSDHPQLSSLDPLFMDKLKLLGRVFETPFKGEHWSHHSVTNVEQWSSGAPAPTTFLSTERKTPRKQWWVNLLPLWPLLFFGFIVVLAGVKFASKIESTSRELVPPSGSYHSDRKLKPRTPARKNSVESNERSLESTPSSSDEIDGVGETQVEKAAALKARKQEEEIQKLLLELREGERRRARNR